MTYREMGARDLGTGANAVAGVGRLIIRDLRTRNDRKTARV